MFVGFGSRIPLSRVEGGEDGGTGPAGDPPPGQELPAPDPGKTFTQAELDKLIEARLTRERGKFKDYDDLKAKAKRLEDIELAGASDLEKAVKTARDEERAAVAREFGEKTVRGVMRAQLLAHAMKQSDADALLDDLNLGKYVADDGAIDEDAIAKTLARLTPKAGPVDLGQGSRGDGPSVDQRIADAQKAGDYRTVIALQNQKLDKSP